MNIELLYWSAGVSFWVENGILYVGALKFLYGAEFFPDYYYAAIRGITKEDLITRFSGSKKAASLTRELIAAKVLIPGVPGLNEMFYGLMPYTECRKDETLFTDPEKLSAFKTSVVRRNLAQGTNSTPVKLIQTEEILENLRRHCTTRSFDREKQLSFSDFSALLSAFGENAFRKDARYYPSAGGLYPIDFYLFVKKNRVEGLSEGIYYYCPFEHALYKINDDVLTEQIHYPTNREIFASSAISIMMVYRSECNIPKYGYKGYAYALLDCGIMTELLYSEANRLGLGCCSIGDMDFREAEKVIGLSSDAVIFHTVEIGCR